MIMYTLVGKKLEKMDVEAGLNGKRPYPYRFHHVYRHALNDQYTLIIDSLNEYIDVVPNTVLQEGTDIFVPISMSRFFSKRYVSPESQRGFKMIKEKHEKLLRDERRGKRIVVFTLCPTFSCNMACTYCYQRYYEKTTNVMTKEQLEEIFKSLRSEIKQVRAESPGTPVVIELFGGEPLQSRNMSVIKKIIGFAEEMACNVWIVSNGYQLFDYGLILAQHRNTIRQISVTLDGPRKYHNERRRVKAIEGSFDKIVKGIDLCLKMGIKISVCTNVDGENILQIKKLIEFIQQKRWEQQEGFKLHIGRVYDRLQTLKRKSIISETAILKSLHSLLPDPENPPRWFTIGFLKSIAYLAHRMGLDLNQNEYGKVLFHYCWATSPIVDGYYLDAMGNTYRCTTTVPVKKYNMGNYNDMQYDSYMKKGWVDHNTFAYKECIQCPIGGFCGGGCRLEKSTIGNLLCDYELSNFKEFCERIAKPYFLKKLGEVGAHHRG